MVFIKFLYRMLREQRLKLIIVVVMMTLVALMEGVTVALLAPLMNLVIGQSGDLPGPLGSVGKVLENGLGLFHLGLTLTVVLVLLVGAFVIQSAFRLLMTHLQTRMLTEYEYSLIHKLFAGYFSSSWGFFVRSQAGQLVNTLTSDTDRAVSACKNACDFLSSFLIAIFYLILSLLLSWQITLAGLVLSAFATLVLKRFMRRSQEYGVGTSNSYSELQSYAFDKIGAAKLLKSSASEKPAIDHMDEITRRRVDLRYRSLMNAAFLQNLYQPLAIAILALVTFVALVELKLSPAVILVFTYIFYRLTPYFSSLQLSYQQVLHCLPSLDVIDEVDDFAKSMTEVHGNKQIGDFKREIIFDGVDFAYPDGASVLKNINLKIGKGESIAIVGESGQGKTTVIDLLLGLFAPTNGRILIDGVNLSEYDPASWRKIVGYMSQDVFLFHDTVEANLKWMVPDASTEKVEASARAAYAHEFIMEMPEGYNTVVGDRGVKLSGGQRQRIALARMILQDPEIIILDEATSALDTESEAKVQESVERLVANKTLIVISHRVSMLRNVLRIYLLQNGSITETNKAIIP